MVLIKIYKTLIRVIEGNRETNIPHKNYKNNSVKVINCGTCLIMNNADMLCNISDIKGSLMSECIFDFWKSFKIAEKN